MRSRNKWLLKGKIMEVEPLNNKKINVLIKGEIYRPNLFNLKVTTGCLLNSNKKIEKGNFIKLNGVLNFTSSSVRFIAQDILSLV